MPITQTGPAVIAEPRLFLGLAMHAALIVLVWFSGLLWLQILPPHWAVTTAILLLACVMARRPLVRLLNRVWVLALVIGVFAMGVPGEAMWYHPWLAAPTREGVEIAGAQLSRLLGAVCMVAILSANLPRQRLLVGLSGLLQPLRLFGISVETVVLRFVLVLELFEATPRHVWRLQAWQDWLNEPETAERMQVHIPVEPWRGRDSLGVLIVLVVWLAGWWMS